ncbi:hypothetical protein DPMN_131160 [Dreissena polymorpha]|uniref:Uncharacterized protein n=1 Tax=Dreissena polymorpha TaxID=45954 RepID=A0A9D4H937_DREPO|nr:hypothetical protein DPMN_131160 [Dreissena polymorpha]
MPGLAIELFCISGQATDIDYAIKTPAQPQDYNVKAITVISRETTAVKPQADDNEWASELMELTHMLWIRCNIYAVVVVAAFCTFKFLN